MELWADTGTWSAEETKGTRVAGGMYKVAHSCGASRQAVATVASWC